MKEEWRIYWKKSRLRVLFQFSHQEMRFLEESELILKSIDHFIIKNGDNFIECIDYRFESNITFDIFNVYTFIDTFFQQQILNERKDICLSLTEEQLFLLTRVSNYLSRYFLPNVCDPFFYLMNYAHKGFAKAKEEYDPDKEIKFDVFCSNIMNKTVAIGVMNPRVFKNKGKTII